MKSAESCEAAAQSWADEAVPLRRGFHHQPPPRSVSSAPRAGLSRAIALAGLCAFALGLLAALFTTFHGGSGSPSPSRTLGSRQQGKPPPHHVRPSIRRRDQSPADAPTVERHQPNPSATPVPARTQPPAPVKSDSSASSASTAAMPTPTPAPSSPPPSSARPEFGL